ncbi:MAG: hypothetical protein KJ000_23125 [Pirellulaceae bacterium]|nr:hypothetical protein [Pirellulaceae bacterium]
MKTNGILEMVCVVCVGLCGFALGYVPSELWASCSEMECKEIVCVRTSRVISPFDMVMPAKAAMVYAPQPNGGVIVSNPLLPVNFFSNCNGGGNLCHPDGSPVPWEAFTCVDCEWIWLIDGAFCFNDGS